MLTSRAPGCRPDRAMPQSRHRTHDRISPPRVRCRVAAPAGDLAYHSTLNRPLLCIRSAKIVKGLETTKMSWYSPEFEDHAVRFVLSTTFENWSVAAFSSFSGWFELFWPIMPFQQTLCATHYGPVSTGIELGNKAIWGSRRLPTV